MTTVTAPVPAPAPSAVVDRDAATRLRHALKDGWTITKRNSRHWVRQPQLIVFSSIQPVMFVLLFNYVFGGSIQIPGIDDYTDFILAGIFAQTVAFGATQTGVGLAEDLAGGVVDRFRSLPMARSAVLVGRTASDAVRNVVVLALLTGVGYLVGFDFKGGFVESVGSLLLVLAFGYSLSWVFALVGLSVPNAESAQAASFVFIFPLTFASSAFTSTQSMPGWLQAFTNNQPVTHVINAVRSLQLGIPQGAEDVSTAVWKAVAWIVAILLVAAPLAVRKYRRAA